jgi:hypothetical protein
MDVPVRGEGRTLFAGILLLLLGFFNVTYGIVMLAEDEIVLQGRAADGVVLIGDLTTWGWVLLILGIVQVLAGFGLIAGQTWARVLGIVAATFAALGQLPVIAGPQPIWSLLVIAGCVWVIHGLVVYGEPLE